MATRPVTFKPKLFVPQGLNNYPGTTFRCFTMGDTLPFEFNFKNNLDDSLPDVTNWTVQVSFSTDLSAAAGLTVDIPVASVDNALFYGEVADEETGGLTPGINYAVASYTNAAGAVFIIDMAIIEVYQNLAFTLN